MLGYLLRAERWQRGLDLRGLGLTGFDRRLDDRRRRSSRGLGCCQERAVDRLGLRRRIGAELVGQEPAALLVDLERLGPVAGGGVRLHQEPVAPLSKRRERDRLLGPLGRLSRITRRQARLGQRTHGATTDLRELASLLHDPESVLPGKKRALEQRGRQLGSGPHLFHLACLERVLRLLGCLRSSGDVNPRAVRQVEPVAAERVRQHDPVVCKQAAQLAHDHRQCLLPGRGRRFPPDRVRKLVPRHRPALGRDQVHEQKPALTPWQAPLIHHSAVRLRGDPTCEEHPQPRRLSHGLTLVLPPSKCAFLACGQAVMEKTLTCNCGHEARAGDDDALAAEVQRHAWQAHGMALSHQEALLLVLRGEPTRLPTTARTTRTESNEEER